MLTQTFTKSAANFSLVIASPSATPLAPEPVRALSCDYGFDFDEEELSRELLAPLAANLSIHSIPEVAAEEFESRYLSFIS